MDGPLVIKPAALVKKMRCPIDLKTNKTYERADEPSYRVNGIWYSCVDWGSIAMDAW